MSRFLFVFLCIVSLSRPVHAQDVSHFFKLYISGLKAGTIHVNGRTSGHAYSLSGAVSSGGLLKRLRDVGYTGTSAGAFTTSQYRPARYEGYTKTGSRTSHVKMRYVAQRPIVDSYLPNRETRAYDIDPTQQSGTLDVLTAAFIVFQDRSLAKLCNKVIPMFDGRRRSQLAIDKPALDGDRATCAGTYTRIAGFSPQDLKERVNFPFTLVYNRLNEDLFRLTVFTTKTTFGTARAVRK